MNGWGAVASIEHLPLSDESVDMIFTDPPYLREYLHVYAWLAREALRVLKPSGFLLAMCGGMYLNQIYRTFDDAGLDYYYELQHLSNGDSPMIWPRRIIARCKPILAYSKGNAVAPEWNIFNFTGKTSKDKRYHIWGQDVGSAQFYISKFSREGDLICDPFVGGGTTAAACELIKRRCVYFDVDPAAIEITQARLASLYLPEQVGMIELAPQLEMMS